MLSNVYACTFLSHTVPPLHTLALCWWPSYFCSSEHAFRLLCLSVSLLLLLVLLWIQIQPAVNQEGVEKEAGELFVFFFFSSSFRVPLMVPLLLVLFCSVLLAGKHTTSQTRSIQPHTHIACCSFALLVGGACLGEQVTPLAG